MINRDEIYDLAYSTYTTEGRAEADRLFESGCKVNYREWSKEQFFDICDTYDHWCHIKMISFVTRAINKLGYVQVNYGGRLVGWSKSDGPLVINFLNEECKKLIENKIDIPIYVSSRKIEDDLSDPEEILP